MEGNQEEEEEDEEVEDGRKMMMRRTRRIWRGQGKERTGLIYVFQCCLGETHSLPLVPRVGSRLEVKKYGADSVLSCALWAPAAVRFDLITVVRLSCGLPAPK